MHQDEAKLISSYLYPDNVFFEWGSGNSTTFYSTFVSRYIAVEHDPLWVKFVAKLIANSPDVSEKVQLMLYPILFLLTISVQSLLTAGLHISVVQGKVALHLPMQSTKITLKLWSSSDLIEYSWMGELGLNVPFTHFRTSRLIF